MTTKSASEFLVEQSRATDQAMRNLLMTKAVLVEFPMATTNGCLTNPRFYVTEDHIGKMTRFDPKFAQAAGGLAYDVLYTEIDSEAGPVRVYVSALYDLETGFARHHELGGDLAHVVHKFVREVATLIECIASARIEHERTWAVNSVSAPKL